MNENKELVAVIELEGLEKSKVDTLMQSFAGYFSEAKFIAEQAKSILVTEETQVEEMKKAREYRLKLKDIRVSADKTRDELKESSRREGNAIQGVYNIIKALVVPVEEYLEKQEKFAEVKEAERLARVYGERVEKLSKYVSDVTLYNIRDMADEVFENLLSGCKISWEKAREDEAKAEADRLAQIEANRIEQEKIRIENQKLKDEADKREAEIAKEREKQAEALKKLNAEKEKAEAKLKEEKEAQAKKEAQEKAEAEARVKADEELKRKALLAPDKEKLIKLAMEFSIVHAPSVESRDADLLLDKFVSDIIVASNNLLEGARKL